MILPVRVSFIAFAIFSRHTVTRYRFIVPDVGMYFFRLFCIFSLCAGSTFRTPYLGEVKVTPLSGFSDPTNL
jgi:hypothetical protein